MTTYADALATLTAPAVPSSLLPTYAAALADGLASSPAGGSIPLWSDALPSTGYVVGGVVASLVLPSPDVLLWWDRTDFDVVLSWLSDHADQLAAADTLGWWVDSETDRAYVDASTVVADLATALALGRDRGEIAVWSLGESREYRCEAVALPY